MSFQPLSATSTSNPLAHTNPANSLNAFSINTSSPLETREVAYETSNPAVSRSELLANSEDDIIPEMGTLSSQSPHPDTLINSTLATRPSLFSLVRLRDLLANLPTAPTTGFWARLIQLSPEPKATFYALLQDTTLESHIIRPELMKVVYNESTAGSINTEELSQQIFLWLNIPSLYYSSGFELTLEQQSAKQFIINYLNNAKNNICAHEPGWQNDIHTAIEMISHQAFPPDCIQKIKALYEIDWAITIQMLISIFARPNAPLVIHPPKNEPQQYSLPMQTIEEARAEGDAEWLLMHQLHPPKPSFQQRVPKPQSSMRDLQSPVARSLFPEFPHASERPRGSNKERRLELCAELISELTEKGNFLSSEDAQIRHAQAIMVLTDNPELFEALEYTYLHSSLRAAQSEEHIEAIIKHINQKAVKIPSHWQS